MNPSKPRKPLILRGFVVCPHVHTLDLSKNYFPKIAQKRHFRESALLEMKQPPRRLTSPHQSERTTMNQVQAFSPKMFVIAAIVFVIVAFNAEAWKTAADEAMCGGECISVSDTIEAVDDSLRVIKSIDN